MRRVMRSSGDLIADRRYQYGLDLAREGDMAAACDLFEQALERAPQWADAWFSLGRARRDRFEPASAAAAFREALRLDPSDVLGASLELSRLDASVDIDAAPLAYVKGLFNSYAEEFDRALVERLGYATPQHLAKMVRDLNRGEARRFARVVDLGCGTGLSGDAFAASASWLEGVDLADAMLTEARNKGVYDALTYSDILSFLGGEGPQYDLMVAADVLIYFGDLTRLFAFAANRIAPGGLFVFSVERAEGGEIVLRDSLRFAHSADYVRRALNGAGLEVATIETAVLRKDRGADIEGLLFVARKSAQAPEHQAQDAQNAQAEVTSKLN
ncbi:MAG: methyltransferase domain-containing protein [Parvularculaceae bacterium]